MYHYVIDTFYLLFFENLYRDFTLIASLVSRMPFFQKLRLSKIAGSSPHPAPSGICKSFFTGSITSIFGLVPL